MAGYYPPVGFHFLVEFLLPKGRPGKNDVRFRDVSGISMELNEETIVEGGENRYIQKLPVRGNYNNLILKRGLLVDTALKKWCEDAIQHLDIQPATVLVSLLNEKHQPLQTYRFVNAWPKKWEISELNAENNAIVVETLELAYQYFETQN